MSHSIKTIGIIGAGTMGQGIAQLCATHGYEVLMFDAKPGVAERSRDAIGKSLDSLVAKNKIEASTREQIHSRIAPVDTLSKLNTHLVIEAAVEDLGIKRQIFSSLEEIVSAEAILTTNTSSIPITQIGSVLRNRERFAGLHFFNPAPVMKLVEIISGASTAETTIQKLKNFAASITRTAVVAQDSPGFIVNRVARHFYVESLKVAEENVVNIEGIDALIKASGFKMGPFELMDLIGVDVNFAVTSSLYNSFHQDPKFRPSRIQQQKVDAGHHGKKSGKGFYNY